MFGYLTILQLKIKLGNVLRKEFYSANLLTEVGFTEMLAGLDSHF